MTKQILTSLLGTALLAATSALADTTTLLSADFEQSDATQEWPAGWPQPANVTWETEDGNSFLRLQSPEPDEMVMLYLEVPIPEGSEAMEITWKQRVSDLKRGEKSWFDARIMMEFMDGAREGVRPGPPTPSTRSDTDGWQEQSLRFNLPENARILKFMPSLFRVNAGTYDLDDIAIRTIPRLSPEEDPITQRRLRHQAQIQEKRDRAAAILENHGSLLPNADFEDDTRNRGYPDHWGAARGPVSYVTEDGNTFLRISAVPDEMALVYRMIDIPDGVEALELTWDWRVSDLRPGPEPWFDARIMMKFKDGSGRDIRGNPSAPYARRSTDGWQTRSRSFLVPEGAVSLEFMPALFRVKSGTLDLDNLILVPTDPEAIRAEQRERAVRQARVHVDPEEAQPENWPAELHVVGNRLHDPEGNEVWLQGVNIASLEWNPRGEQVMKSTQVATEVWNANAIRLPVKEEYWFGPSADAYRKLVDDIIIYAANRGAYTILDLHRYRAPRQEHLEFWLDAAERYKNHPAVLFDLLNEPHSTSWEVWRNGGFISERKTQADEDAFLAEADLAQSRQGFQSVGMQALVDAVRSTGARNIVVVGGLDWAYDLSGILNGYAIDEHPDGNGIMYSTHVYTWKRDWQNKFLNAAEHYPILVGEFGADETFMDWLPAERQEDPYTWMPDILGLIQKHRLNYTAWCFHPRASPRMLVDWDYTPTPYLGQKIKDAINGKQFDMTRMR